MTTIRFVRFGILLAAVLAATTGTARASWIDLNAPNGDFSTAGFGGTTWTSATLDAGSLYQNWNVARLFTGATAYRGAYGNPGDGLRLQHNATSTRTVKLSASHDAWGGNIIENKIYRISFDVFNETPSAASPYGDDRGGFGFLHNTTNQNEYRFGTTWAAWFGGVRFAITPSPGWARYVGYWNNTALPAPAAVLADYAADPALFKPAILDYGLTIRNYGDNLRFGLNVAGWTIGGDPRFDNFKVEVFQDGAPEIAVSGDGNNILDGDATPSLTDFTDFGSTSVGNPIQRTFRVDNTGTLDLTTASLTLPADFSIVEGLSSTILAGGFDTFTVQFDATSAGTFSGDINFVNDDGDGGDGVETPFNFAITATATAIVPEPSTFVLSAFGLAGISLLCLRKRDRRVVRRL